MSIDTAPAPLRRADLDTIDIHSIEKYMTQR